MSLREQLDLRKRHPEYQDYLDYNERESDRVREQYSCTLDLKYGNSDLQSVDIFPSPQENSPILIFIHGGYWRALDKRNYSFVAEPFIKNNVTAGIVNYRLLPSVDMNTLLNDVEASISLIRGQASRFNGNPDSVTLSGHSAGGHLALMAYIMNEDLRASITSICSISGIFDLAPIKESYLNEELHLTDSEVEEFSVTNKDLSVLACPTLLSVGSEESVLFIEESKALHQKSSSMAPTTYLEYQGLNHYEIVHELGQQDSQLADFILKNCKR